MVHHIWQGESICDFLFALLYTKPLLKMGLLLKAIWHQKEKILSLKSLYATTDIPCVSFYVVSQRKKEKGGTPSGRAEKEK